jgi:hypothetical protein
MSNPFDKIKPREFLKNQTAKLGKFGEALNTDVKDIKPKEILRGGQDFADKLGIKSQDLMRAVFDYADKQGEEFSDVICEVASWDYTKFTDFCNTQQIDWQTLKNTKLQKFLVMVIPYYMASGFAIGTVGKAVVENTPKAVESGMISLAKNSQENLEKNFEKQTLQLLNKYFGESVKVQKLEQIGQKITYKIDFAGANMRGDYVTREQLTGAKNFLQNNEDGIVGKTSSLSVDITSGNASGQITIQDLEEKLKNQALDIDQNRTEKNANNTFSNRF